MRVSVVRGIGTENSTNYLQHSTKGLERSMASGVLPLGTI